MFGIGNVMGMIMMVISTWTDTCCSKKIQAGIADFARENGYCYSTTDYIIVLSFCWCQICKFVICSCKYISFLCKRFKIQLSDSDHESVLIYRLDYKRFILKEISFSLALWIKNNVVCLRELSNQSYVVFCENDTWIWYKSKHLNIITVSDNVLSGVH